MSEDIARVVKEKYGEAARKVRDGGERAGCCGSSGAGAECGSRMRDSGPAAAGVGPTGSDPITRDLYDRETTSALPESAVLASLGCGNPTALAELREGEVVLDLGSGGGIDVLLSARRVGPAGKAYGVDMTPEMLELSRKAAAEAGVDNAEFLHGEIEAVPLPDASVDVIISNCVINLSADKRQVLREAYRVLKPGGRFAVSDVVVRGAMPAELRRNMELWVGCVAGALEEEEFLRLLRETGFENPSIEPTRIYRLEDARAFLEEAGLDVEAFADAVEGRVMAAFVRARKPKGAGF